MEKTAYWSLLWSDKTLLLVQTLTISPVSYDGQKPHKQEGKRSFSSYSSQHLWKQDGDFWSLEEEAYLSISRNLSVYPAVHKNIYIYLKKMSQDHLALDSLANRSGGQTPDVVFPYFTNGWGALRSSCWEIKWYSFNWIHLVGKEESLCEYETGL